ncbi:transglycosylase domain-containing protein [Alkalihalobacterium elongatum]|uniref:transglycosylase domain-containing protein n=1 Tax=Alkalihalobacterium elongatum TaxID=2675466 RepID=UPI001C1F583C|nr:transglycosylase domain-containing protein [Alkalihalobacterium elongatum]
MRIGTGLFLTAVLLVIFSFMTINTVNEMSNIQSIQSVLDEHIKIKEVQLSTNSYMYDRHGNLISEVYQAVNRIYLPFEDIPQTVINAFIATEDRRFLEHRGYDPASIVRAFITNYKNNSIEEGASTITQQLVRNLFLSHDQTYDRKLSELLYAYKLEQLYTKEKIIELYINTIFFHNGVYGFEAASHYYFSKPSNELTLAEISFLCAIPNNPSHYNPVKNSQNTKLRQQWILEKMLEAEAIGQKEYEKAIDEPIQLALSKKVDLYPDYVTYIHYELTQLIAYKEGYKQQLENATSESKRAVQQKLDERVQKMYEKGIRIETALDPDLQRKSIEATERNLPNNDIQSSAVIIHHPTKEIVAITGGRNYKKFDFHRGYQAFRQPGSTIKPLLVYAPYIAEHSVSNQSSVNADNFCKKDYCPKNFGGAQYGIVSLETAFKHSYNTPAVRILDRTGVDTSFRYLDKFSFSRLIPNDYRLSAALGGFTNGMSPLELTKAYTTFANDGIYQSSYGIRRVTDLKGNVLYEWNETPQHLWNSSVNQQMKVLLNKVVTEGTGKRANQPSTYIGGKTGTTNSFHDIWFVGIKDDYTAGVWVGKDQPSSLQSIYSRGPHIVIWRDIMRNIK